MVRTLLDHLDGTLLAAESCTESEKGTDNAHVPHLRGITVEAAHGLGESE